MPTCPDSPTGKHEWMLDEEYDPHDPPTVCEHCGLNAEDDQSHPDPNEIAERYLQGDYSFVVNAFQNTHNRLAVAFLAAKVYELLPQEQRAKFLKGLENYPSQPN
jgi:hypothetical protein